MKVRTVIRRLPKIIRNAIRDLRFGKPLGGTIKSRYAHLGAHDVGHADYDDLAILFREADIRPDDEIVDVGAGKVLAIHWFMRAHPGYSILGMDTAPATLGMLSL